MTFHPTINGHPYPNWMGNQHPFGVFPFRSRDGRWGYPSGVYPHQQTKWGNFFNCGVDFGVVDVGRAVVRQPFVGLRGHCCAEALLDYAQHYVAHDIAAVPTGCRCPACRFAVAIHVQAKGWCRADETRNVGASNFVTTRRPELYLSQREASMNT
ncbi:hypothetical protein PUN4_550019 [Paraburkholderia unamae]|nr:hypothetical protein PUN4_550019 [Paraburkholderia unamae]